MPSQSAACPKCGSQMYYFKNPPRMVCPTPEKHKSLSLGKNNGGGRKPKKNGKGK